MNLEYYKKKYEPIDGKWYIKELLGEGGFGKVFRIEREDMSGQYNAALKIITIPKSQNELENIRESLQDENSVSQYFENMTQKLVEEFKLMAQLKGHTNIVSYEDHNILKHTEDVGYDVLIRMELLEPLSKKKEEFSEQDVIQIGIDICKALEVCQKFNVVHRDIKPENIFIAPSGDYKLGDFGVAKTMNNEMTVMTTTGTYSYMAPELKKGEKCGTNVDIYSLGMVMYRLLNCNREPFLPLPPSRFTFEDREQALIRRMQGEQLPAPAKASERLSEIIIKACDFDPQNRYESPLQMRMELENLVLNNTAERELANTVKKNINNESKRSFDPDATVRITEDDIAANNVESSSKDKAQSGYEKQEPVAAAIKTDQVDKTLFIPDAYKPEYTNSVKIPEPISTSSYAEQKNPVTFDNTGYNSVKYQAYSVILEREKTIDNDGRSVDVYVDGLLIAEKIKDDSYTLNLESGPHNIVLKISQDSKIHQYIDKANHIAGFGAVQQELALKVYGKTTINYRLNALTGGIEQAFLAKPRKKNKLIALLLAVFPYTGLFGGYHFYQGDKKQGVLRACTINFMGFGWILDIVIAIIDLFNNKDNQSH